MSRVSARGWLRRGCVSRAFSATDLATALQEREPGCQIYLELDAEGCVSREGGAGAAAAACAARLAPHVHARCAVLELAPTPAPAPAPALRLRLLADLPPLQELLLWLDEDLLALVDMPFLTLRNIRGKKEYVCHECGERFEQPNPLKVHLFLSCAQYSPARFWRTLVARVRGAAAPSACRRDLAAPPPAAPAPLPALEAQDARAARLEALAAEWGRSRDGHLCLYCGKLYSRKYGLKIHIRTHTGYRPLRCRYCLRAFGDPSNLNKHVRLHAGPRAAAPHGCALCGKALARRRDLERHLRAHAAPACGR